MRIIFMGTPDFAVAALNSLISAGHDVAAVVTQPDKAKGRSGKAVYTPVKETAVKNNIKVFQPEKVRDKDFTDVLKCIAPDVIVVAAFGQILTQEILDIPKYGCINIHASLLPKYRGAAPIQRAIINGETESGVTTMYMSAGLDTGDMIDRIVVPLDDKETGGSLHNKLAAAGAKLIVKTLNDIENGTASREKQDDAYSCYAKMLKKSEGHIDFNDSAAQIERLVRGLDPWPSAYTYIDGRMLKIWSADAIEEEYDGMPGQIVKIEKEKIYIKTGNGTLVVTELQPEGKKRMSAGAFLLGNNIDKEMVLC